MFPFHGNHFTRSLPILLLLVTTACSGDTAGIIETVEPPPPSQPANPSLPLEMSWQVQYSGELDTALDVDMFNLDLFETDPEIIRDLKQRGVFVVCYFSAGSYEDWKPDVKDFPADTLGKPMKGWKGETWLDIRQIDALKPVMESRLDLAVEKGCDGVDPDNVNGYENDTGFPLTYEDQLAFNIFLSNAARERRLLIGLKNDLDQIRDLLPHFDWILNEECFPLGECELLLPFIEAGKPVFILDYGLSPWGFCKTANEMNFNLIHKRRSLGAYRISCR